MQLFQGSEGGVRCHDPESRTGACLYATRYFIVGLLLYLVFSWWGFEILWFVNINNSYPKKAFPKSFYLCRLTVILYSTTHSSFVKHMITFLSKYLNPKIFYYSRRQLLKKLRGAMIVCSHRKKVCYYNSIINTNQHNFKNINKLFFLK